MINRNIFHVNTFVFKTSVISASLQCTVHMISGRATKGNPGIRINLVYNNALITVHEELFKGTCSEAGKRQRCGSDNNSFGSGSTRASVILNYVPKSSRPNSNYGSTGSGSATLRKAHG
jgi:hypothetical protein